VLNASIYSGADMGAKINAAYFSAQCASTGCHVTVPAAASCWTFTTPIVANTSGKPILLTGTPGKATCLNYTPSTGTAITLDWGVSERNGGIRDLYILGPGPATSSIGLQWGLSNGADNSAVVDTIFQGFGKNITIGAPAQSFLLIMDRVTSAEAGQTLVASTNQEDIRITDSVFSNYDAAHDAKCVDIEPPNSAQLSIKGTSFDECQVYSGPNVAIDIEGGHFENPAQGAYDFLQCIASLRCTLVGVDMLQDKASAANAETISVSGNGTNLTLVGGSYFSASSQTNFITCTAGTPIVSVLSQRDSSFAYSGPYVNCTNPIVSPRVGQANSQLPFTQTYFGNANQQIWNPQIQSGNSSLAGGVGALQLNPPFLNNCTCTVTSQTTNPIRITSITAGAFGSCPSVSNSCLNTAGTGTDSYYWICTGN
jgi:hypothetical protein